MQRGTIKVLNEKGYGFLSSDDGGNEIFFHASSLEGVQFNELKEGAVVIFDSEEGEKGLKATRVMLDD